MAGANCSQGLYGWAVTLAELTTLMSKIGRKHPELMQDRNVALFIQLCIEEARKAKP